MEHKISTRPRNTTVIETQQFVTEDMGLCVDMLEHDLSDNTLKLEIEDSERPFWISAEDLRGLANLFNDLAEILENNQKT